jgi:hypothetical protein
MMQSAVVAQLNKLRRRDRVHALGLLRRGVPIRFLGGCLRCGDESTTVRVGIYVPRVGSPLQQVAVWTFCEVHAAASRILLDEDIENLVALEASRRPHVLVVDGLQEVRA